MPRRIPSRVSFRIRYALLALLAAILLGTIGFHFIERWPLAESLYVTVQTLTTVGYGDQLRAAARAVCSRSWSC
jgi:ion channel